MGNRQGIIHKASGEKEDACLLRYLGRMRIVNRVVPLYL